MKRILSFLLLPIFLFSQEIEILKQNFNIVTKKIHIPKFHKAFNACIYKSDQGIILTFRYHPDPIKHWISQAYIVHLDEDLNVISHPQQLKFRDTSAYPPIYSDCRIIPFQDKKYIIYTDFTDFEYPPGLDYNPFYDCREYLQLAELEFLDSKYVTKTPVKLIYEAKQYTQLRQKNWTPFEYNGKFYLSYYFFPHEIIELDLKTGDCELAYFTPSSHFWKWGDIRGSTSAQLVDGNYLTFFHSSKTVATPQSKGNLHFHYFIGALIFSSEPPFEILKASPEPIIAEDFYTFTGSNLHCVFPLGFIVIGEDIYISYGKDDHEIWIAKISKKELLDSLISVKGESGE